MRRFAQHVLDVGMPHEMIGAQQVEVENGDLIVRRRRVVDSSQPDEDHDLHSMLQSRCLAHCTFDTVEGPSVKLGCSTSLRTCDLDHDRSVGVLPLQDVTNLIHDQKCQANSSNDEMMTNLF